jgi:hypothetical protein
MLMDAACIMKKVSVIAMGLLFLGRRFLLSQLGTWLLSVMRTPVALPPSSNERALQERRRFTPQPQDLEQLLADETKRLREKAQLLPPGALRDKVTRKARQAETGSHVSEWLRSPGLQSPK